MSPLDKGERKKLSPIELKKYYANFGCSSAVAATLFSCAKSEIATRTKRAVSELNQINDRTIDENDVREAVMAKKRGGARASITKFTTEHTDHLKKLLSDPATKL